MDYVITLIANPARERLPAAFAESMAPSLALQGIRVEKTQWLKEGVACDLLISPSPFQGEGWDEGMPHRKNPHPDPLPGREREWLGWVDKFVQDIVRDQPFDAVVQPYNNRRKKLLISDMDSTMITVECIDELADFVGKKAHVAAITERAMNGELDFAAALTERVALLAGLPEAVLEDCYRERVKMMAGAKALVQGMRAGGAHCILVSGGFTFFTSRVRAELGFHEDFSNRLEIEDGRLTGRVLPPILGKEAKLATLQESVKKLGISAADVLAVGDGANDLPMLMAAGLGVAYHAKPVVRAQAGARIDHCDLSALLWVQGII